MAILLALACWASGCDRSQPEPVRERIDHRSVEDAIQAADVYVSQGQLAEALLICNGILEKAPDQQAALQMVAELSQALSRDTDPDQAGQYMARALDVRRRLVQLDPDQPRARLEFGIILQQMRMRHEAIEQYRVCTELDPGSSEALRLLGHALLQDGQLDQSREAFMRLGELDPDAPWAWAGLGQAWMVSGDHDKALELIDRAIEIDPDQRGLRILRSRVLRKQSRFKESLEFMMAFVPEERADPAATWEIAQAWRGLGQPDKAADAWAGTHVANQPDFLSALRAAKAYQDAGQLERAGSWLDAAKLDAARTGLPTEEMPLNLEDLSRWTDPSMQ